MKTQDIIDAYEMWFIKNITEQEKEFLKAVGERQESVGFLAGYIAAMESIKAMIKPKLSMELNNDVDHGALFVYEDIYDFIGEIE